MNQSASQGPNRTGIATDHTLAERMQAGVDEFAPTSTGSIAAAGLVRLQYARETLDGRALGSVPQPITPPRPAVVPLRRSSDPTMLLDKLGERLVFERTGTRLYEALVSKHEADGGFPGGPTRAELLEILNDEHRHFALLVEAIKSLGGDPTALTPSADVASTLTTGVLKVITDPRTTLLQGLEAILLVELADGDGWMTLVEITYAAEKSGLMAQFELAEQIEARHLAKVRRWIRAAQGLEVE